MDLGCKRTKCMSIWRYVQNQKPLGPVETSELRTLLASGAITPETLVWKPGMVHWAQAGSLPEITAPPAADAAAPPIPPAAGTPKVSTPSGANDADADDVQKNKIFAVLAYLGILFLVPLLAAPHSKFARYHTNQGLVLFLFSLVLSGAATSHLFIPFIGPTTAVLSAAAGICSLVLMILGIINAASGVFKPLPLIGHFQIIK